MSEIYEVEMVDDGGYKYSLVNTLFTESLIDETFSEPSKTLKKVFQLQPNLSHMILNTADADFSDTAKSQADKVTIGSATESIWNKTFKLRLSSKKTGKKVDINVTYNLKQE